MQINPSTSPGQPEAVFTIEGMRYRAILIRTCQDPLFTDDGCGSIFQHKGYHAALEASPPRGMRFWYVRLEHEGTWVGMLSFQVKDFNPGNSLKNQVDGSILQRIRYALASRIQLDTLILGNTLLTGDYGFCFHPDVSPRLKSLLMMESIDWMLTLGEFKKIRLVFVKDFYEDILKEIPDSPYCKRYHSIDTMPNMIMEIDQAWNSMEGYLNTIKSKYRIRAKKALSLAEDLERVELNAEEIEKMEDLLHQLYLKVVDDVGFNLFILSKGYFTALKKSLGDRFRLWIYKEKGEVISFFTVFEDGDILDAHFLGYDPEVNHRYKLYLNMLLSMIDFAAVHGFRQLQLSRTATEIKSSVGANGVTMWSYLRHTKRFINSLLPRLYAFFKPNLEWTPRNPFHE